MLQDLNPTTCSFLVIFMWAYWVCKTQGSIFLALQLQSLSGKCAKLQTVAERNVREYLTRSLYYCLFLPHIIVCCSSHTSHSWWIAVSMQLQLRDCNIIPSVLQWTAPIAFSFCEGCIWHHPSHPGHNTSLLRLENPSEKGAKFHTVAASNRDHTSCSLYFCSFAPHI